MTLPANIDIDRVHDVLEGRRLERGAGHTTAMFVQIWNSLQFGSHTDIVVFAASHNVCKWLMREFSEFMKNAGIPTTSVSDRVIVNDGSYVKFVPVEPYERYIRGVKFDNYYIDNSITMNPQYQKYVYDIDRTIAYRIK